MTPERDAASVQGEAQMMRSAGESAWPARPRRIYSPALFRGDREVSIIHQGQEYRLRITKADKLILTK